ncbi:MAG: hypothetical protein Kow0047_30920 [Anaerolineae bacterium]
MSKRTEASRCPAVALQGEDAWPTVQLLAILAKSKRADGWEFSAPFDKLRGLDRRSLASARRSALEAR